MRFGSFHGHLEHTPERFNRAIQRIATPVSFVERHSTLERSGWTESRIHWDRILPDQKDMGSQRQSGRRSTAKPAWHAQTQRPRAPLACRTCWWMGFLFCLPLVVQGAVVQPVKPSPESPSAGPGKVPALQSDTIKSTPAPGELVTQVQAKLADAQARLSRLLASLSGSTNIPPGATAAEAIEYRSALQRLVRTCQFHLDDLAALEAARQRQEEFSQTVKVWTGFGEPPPYSVLLVDELRDSIQSFNAEIKAAEVTGDVVEKFLADAQTVMRESDEKLRRLTEQLEAAKDPIVVARLTWQRELEQARSRVAAATAASFETKRQLVTGQLAESRQRLAFAQRRLALAAGQDRFSQDDLDKVMDDLGTEQRRLVQEIQDAETALDGRQRALVEAREALRKALQEQSAEGTNAAVLRRLQEVVAVRDIERQTGVQTLTVLRQLLEGIGNERQMWQMRFAVFASRDLAELQAASRTLGRFSGLIQAAKPYYRQQIDLAAAQVTAEEKRLLSGGGGEADPVLTRQRIESYQQREALYQRALQGLEKHGRAVVRWQEALAFNRKALPFTGRVRDLFAEASSFVSKLWGFEIYVVEDSIMVDNQRITGRRGVTIGKIVMAILILGVGYWVSKVIARLLEGLAVTRFKVEPNQASLIRRWVSVVLVMGLVVFALVSVKIPLTVFAFAGGALAIGVGFGTQTLLKNFISGILLLFERPFRVGDLLDVAGYRGTVTAIGIRSSVIQLWDGTEAFIPNSALLENNLTNWTYSNRMVRFSITLGVAYGSDTRRVAQLLAEVADRHGLVEKDPRPQVLFTEFGDNALTFELRYWVNVVKHNAAQLASDLRHMIGGAFREQGIVMAFPQRDVHLTADKPIEFQMVAQHCPAESSGPAENPPGPTARAASGLRAPAGPGAHTATDDQATRSATTEGEP